MPPTTQSGIVAQSWARSGTIPGGNVSIHTRIAKLGVMQKPFIQPEIQRPGIVAYAALFALALFQLGFALHAGEHSVTELAEPCGLCVGYDQQGTVTFTVAAAIATPTFANDVPHSTAAPIAALPYTLQPTRAPPPFDTT